jgi:hypothetical protein
MRSGAWWRVAVDSKYGSLWGGWCSREVAGAFGVGLWKFIRKGWENFSKFLRFEVGDGSRIRFWHDLWCGDSILKEVFPDLFGIARVKDASVADNLESLGGSIQWNVSFIREAHDWEVDVFASFFQVLGATKVNFERADCLKWVPSKKGVFGVKSYFGSMMGSGGTWFPWKCVWRSQAPPRAAFFTWSAALGRILTLDNLRKRHIIIVDRCCLCKRDGESVDHILLHCDLASTLWNNIFSRFGISWVMPRSVLELVACWWKSGRSGSATSWKMVPICLFGCIWRERNLRYFENLESSLEEVLELFLHTLYVWSMAYLYPLSISFAEFLASFSLSS